MKESLKRLFAYEGRCLIRHTQQYSMILNMSLFPEFLKSKEKRDLFLHVLDKQNLRPSIHAYERCALTRMDIPIFIQRAGLCRIVTEESIRNILMTLPMKFGIKR